MEQLPEVQQKKYDAWGSFGLSLQRREDELTQMAAQVAPLLHNLPSENCDIVEAEQTLAKLKQQRKAIEEKRKEITSRFDGLARRLMEPEKLVDQYIEKYSQSLITAKKKAEEKTRQQQEEREKTERRKDTLRRMHDDEIERVRSLISDKTQKALQLALDSDIEPKFINKQLEEWMEAYKNKFRTNPINVPGATEQEINEYAARVDMYDEFCERLKSTFSDYHVAFENKEKAMELAKREAEKQAEEREKEKERKRAAEQLESMAAEITAPQGKSLKKSYEIDMPETVESAIAIMAAFVANAPQCLHKLKVKKWFAFTPKQAGIALAKVKCDDNAFQPSGINFKEVDKL